MASSPNIEVIKKNTALVMGLVASILITPPEIEQAQLPVKWLAINGVLATVIAGLFATKFSRYNYQRLKTRVILLGAFLLLLFSGFYYGCYSNWTCTCSTGKYQYPVIIGSSLTTDGQHLADNLKKIGQTPSIENILFQNKCSSRNIYPKYDLLIRYFSLIGIYLTVSILLMALLSIINYLIYYHVAEVPEF